MLLLILVCCVYIHCTALVIVVDMFLGYVSLSLFCSNSKYDQLKLRQFITLEILIPFSSTTLCALTHIKNYFAEALTRIDHQAIRGDPSALLGTKGLAWTYSL